MTWLRSAWRWVREHTVALAVGAWAIASLFLTLGGWRKRPERLAKPGDAEHLAEALRPALQKRADEARKQADAHAKAAVDKLVEAEREAQRVREMSHLEVLRATEDYARKKRAARSKAGLLVLLAALSVPCSARAADDALPEYTPHPTSKAPGWWIPDDIWRAALEDATSAEHYQAAVVELSAEVAALRQESEALRLRLQTEESLNQALTVRLKLAEDVALSERQRADRANRWYRSPKLWLAVGAVAGASLATFAVLEVAR